MRKIMKTAAFFSIAAAGLASALYAYFRAGIFLTLSITFGTTAYHFIMRLLVAGVIHSSMRYKMHVYAFCIAYFFLYPKLKKKPYKGGERAASFYPAILYNPQRRRTCRYFMALKYEGQESASSNAVESKYLTE